MKDLFQTFKRPLGYSKSPDKMRIYLVWAELITKYENLKKELEKMSNYITEDTIVRYGTSCAKNSRTKRNIEEDWKALS